MSGHLGNIPKIAFIKDKTAARASEVDRLLELADMGPDDATDVLAGSDDDGDEVSSADAQLSYIELRHDVCGLDRAALMAKVQSGRRVSPDAGGVTFDINAPGDLFTKQARKTPDIRLKDLYRKTLVHGDASAEFAPAGGFFLNRGDEHASLDHSSVETSDYSDDHDYSYDDDYNDDGFPKQ